MHLCSFRKWNNSSKKKRALFFCSTRTQRANQVISSKEMTSYGQFFMHPFQTQANNYKTQQVIASQLIPFDRHTHLNSLLLNHNFLTQKCTCSSSRFDHNYQPKPTTLHPTLFSLSKEAHKKSPARKIGLKLLGINQEEEKMNSFVSSALSQILTNLALKKEGFLFALLAYRHLIAAACIAPIALYFDRGRINELKQGRVWFWAFLTALTGITMGMGFFYYGVTDTSAAYATNYSNLIPIITFLFSVLIRMEKLEVSTLWGKAKGLGAVICVGGALIISLYSGPSLVNTSHHKMLVVKPYANLVRGTILLIASCFGYAFWFVVQAKLLRVLPSKHWSNFLTCLVAAVQCAVLGVCLDRSSKAWSLGWDVNLLCVSVSGIFASALAFYLILWAVELKDPSYPSMFDPFSVVFVAVIQAIFFGDQFTLGLLLGMILMIVGLYCYLWGKRREDLSAASKAPLCLSPSVSVKNHPAPLLI